MTMIGYDIIGDIHGHAEPLRALLHHLGYSEHNGTYSHANRRAIFVGDFIDRGPRIRETLEIVRTMVDAGTGLAVLGNHEWNALRFHTVGPDGKPLRPHYKKNVKQHRATLDQIVEPHPEEWAAWLAWFKGLPLYLDVGGLRVVHAAWCPAAIAKVKGRNFADSEFLLASGNMDSEENAAIRMLLTGPEIDLPDGHEFIDKEGHKHGSIRARWCGVRRDSGAITYRDMVFPACDTVPKIAVPADFLRGVPDYPANDPVVIFGHYWLAPHHPPAKSTNAACVDTSVAISTGGRLTAYRWDGEPTIDPRKFISVPSNVDGWETAATDIL